MNPTGFNKSALISYIELALPTNKSEIVYDGTPYDPFLSLFRNKLMYAVNILLSDVL